MGQYGARVYPWNSPKLWSDQLDRLEIWLTEFSNRLANKLIAFSIQVMKIVPRAYLDSCSAEVSLSVAARLPYKQTLSFLLLLLENDTP